MELPDGSFFRDKSDDHHIVEPGPTTRKDVNKEVEAGAFHTETLYDQDEDKAGEKVNLATGKPFDNSTDLGYEHLTIRDDKTIDGIRDEQEGDAADEWLKAEEAKLKNGKRAA